MFRKLTSNLVEGEVTFFRINYFHVLQGMSGSINNKNVCP